MEKQPNSCSGVSDDAGDGLSPVGSGEGACLGCPEIFNTDQGAVHELGLYGMAAAGDPIVWMEEAGLWTTSLGASVADGEVEEVYLLSASALAGIESLRGIAFRGSTTERPASVSWLPDARRGISWRLMEADKHRSLSFK